MSRYHDEFAFRTERVVVLKQDDAEPPCADEHAELHYCPFCGWTDPAVKNWARGMAPPPPQSPLS